MKGKKLESKSAESFNRFRDLAKNLIAVPKKEIDKQRVAYDNRQNKKEKPAK